MLEDNENDQSLTLILQQAAGSETARGGEDGEEGAALGASYNEDNSEQTVLDLNDPDMMDAALKIQAGFTGFKVRQELTDSMVSKL